MEDLRVEDSIYIGMNIEGNNTVVRRNGVFNTGGTSTPGDMAFGVRLDGGGMWFQNNSIGGTVGDVVYQHGLLIANSNGTVVEGNHIDSIWCVVEGCLGRGIDVAISSNMLIVDNRITSADAGIRYGIGSGGKYRDNLTSGILEAAYDGGTDAGGND